MDGSASVAHATPLVRRLLQALGGAWAGGVLANLVFAIFDGSRATRLTVVLILLLLGSIVGWLESRDAGPWRAGDVREGAIGWVIIAAIMTGSIASVALPMPWAVAPGIAALALTFAFALEGREPAGTPRQPDEVA